MKSNPYQVKLEEITADKLVEIDIEVENIRLRDLTLDSLNTLSKSREDALAYYQDIELQCRVKALAARNLGFSKAELARIFKVTTNTITKWIG